LTTKKYFFRLEGRP